MVTTFCPPYCYGDGVACIIIILEAMAAAGLDIRSERLEWRRQVAKPWRSRTMRLDRLLGVIDERRLG